MKDVFSLARVRQLFVYDWTMYYKEKLFLALLVFLSVFSVFLFWRLDFQITAILAMVISGIVITFSLHFIASHIFANARTKQDSIAFLMLPATKFEKFFVRFVDFSVIPAFIIIVVASLSLGLCCLFLGWDFMCDLYDKFLNGYQVMLQNPQFSLYFADIRSYFWSMILSCAASVGIYTLGGTIFGRFAFVKTLAIMLGFDMVYSIILSSAMQNVEVVLDSMKILGFWFNIILAFACPVISYVIYSKKQVV